MKYVAVEGMTLVFTSGVNPAVVVYNPVTGSPNVSVDGNGVCLDGLTLTATSWEITVGSLVYAGAGTVTADFSSSAEYVSVDGKKVLLEGDEATLNVEATNVENPSDTQLFSITAKIVMAGQTVMKAD